MTRHNANPRPAREPAIVPWTDLRDLPRPDTLFGAFVQHPGATVLFGEPGSGKSFLALAWAAHVATGTPWAGSEADGVAVYWPGEAGWSVPERLEAWQSHHGLTIPGDRLAVVTDADTLDIDGAAERLGNAVADRDARLLVADTLSKTKGGGLSEYDNDDMAAYLDRIERINRATGAAAVIVHHSGWSEKQRERGASALRANADQVLLLERSAAGRTLIMKKNRGGPDDYTQPLATIAAGGSLVLAPTERVDLTDQEQKILDAVRWLTAEGEWAIPAEIATRADVDRRRVHAAADKLTAASLVRIDPHSGPRNSHRYQATDRPETPTGRSPTPDPPSDTVHPSHADGQPLEIPW